MAGPESFSINPYESSTFLPKELNYGAEFSEVQRYHKELYGDRNDFYRRSRKSRIRSIQRAIHSVEHFVRHDGKTEDIALLTGRTLLRALSIGDAVNGVNLTQGMIEKFTVCARCRNIPCICIDKSSDSQLSYWSPDDDKNQWSIYDWQMHLRDMYGDRNKKAGFDNVTARLLTETIELSLIEDNVYTLSQDQIRMMYREEIADTVAWTLGVGNVLDINVEKAFIDRYGHGCWRCGQIPCTCGSPSAEQIRIGDIDYGLRPPTGNYLLNE